MTNQEIIEGNKLIAKFMNCHTVETIKGIYYNFPHDDKYVLIEEAKYSFSPEWLFPVLEKICRMKIGDGKEFVEYAYPRTFGMLNQETGEIMVRLEGYQLFKADTLIEATWLAVVDFIKYTQNDKI